MNERPPRNVFQITVPKPQEFSQFPNDSRFLPALITGSVRLEIETLAPLHTGSGNYGLDPQGGLIKQIVRRRDDPIIPGSSIKGAIRQMHEVVTQSLGPFDRDPHQRDGVPTLTTRLFGSLRHQGRISFDDAVAAAPVAVDQVKLSVAYPPPKNDLGRRFYGHLPTLADQPRTIQAEAIPTGVTLHTVLRSWNVLPEELGSVLATLGLERFTPRLGGAKYDHFGWVRFRVTGFRFRKSLLEGRQDWIEDPNDVQAEITNYLSAFQPRGTGTLALRRLEKELQGPDPSALYRGTKS